MSESCTDRYGKILESFLGEEQLRQCKKLGFSENRLMKLYHQDFDRDQEAFRNGVENMLNSKHMEELEKLVKKKIDILTKEIETLQGFQLGKAEDHILEEADNQ